MSAAKPPLGYISLAEATELTGYSAQTITRAAKSGELKALQRVKNSSWFFKPADLRTWLGVDTSVSA
jgi:helix-turn-helix protein